jgi:hypothetical protein
MQKIAIAALLSMLAGSAFAEAMTTPASGPKCKDKSAPELGLWTCPGPGGYAVRFADEGNIVSFTIAPARLMEKTDPTTQWRGAGDAFGKKLQWVMRDGVPKAAVIRTWRRGEDEREIQELTVFAIDGKRACVYGAVPARQVKANELALAKAEESAGTRCPEN